jgi:hypothetical protein
LSGGKRRLQATISELRPDFVAIRLDAETSRDFQDRFQLIRKQPFKAGIGKEDSHPFRRKQLLAVQEANTSPGYIFHEDSMP